MSHAWDYFFDRETFDSDEEEEICLYRDDQTDADILRNSEYSGYEPIVPGWSPFSQRN